MAHATIQRAAPLVALDPRRAAVTLIDAVTFEIDTVGRRVTAQLGTHPGYRAVQALDGPTPSWPRFHPLPSVLVAGYQHAYS
jgi:hypothetical protein